MRSARLHGYKLLLHNTPPSSYPSRPDPSCPSCVIHFAALIAAGNSAGSAAAAAAAVFQLLSVRLVPEAVAAAEGTGMFRLATLLSQVRHYSALRRVRGVDCCSPGGGLLKGRKRCYTIPIAHYSFSPCPHITRCRALGGRWATMPTLCT